MTLPVPAHLMGRASRGLGASLTQGLGGAQMPAHISIKGNRFTLVDAAGNEKPHNMLDLDVVIVDANPALSKVYYADAYDPTATEYKPPTCFSDNGIGPSSQALTPQHSNCATCPHNIWGSSTSKVTGKQTKACSDTKKLAVFVPHLGQDVVFQLRIPPASLKNLKTYAQSLSGNSIGDRPVEPADVVTKLTFDAQTQGVLNFAPVSFIDETVAGWIDKLDTDGRSAAIVGRTDTVHTGVLAAQPAPQAIAPPQPAPQPAFLQAAPASPAFAQAQQEAPKGRGRPKKAAEPEDDVVPAFLKQPDQSFNMAATPAAPSPELQNALAAAFSLKTGG
jgi:hypothetical protein